MGYCNIEVGQKMIGYWGARHPYTYGVVKAIDLCNLKAKKSKDKLLNKTNYSVMSEAELKRISDEGLRLNLFMEGDEEPSESTAESKALEVLYTSEKYTYSVTRILKTSTEKLF